MRTASWLLVVLLALGVGGAVGYLVKPVAPPPIQTGRDLVEPAVGVPLELRALPAPAQVETSAPRDDVGLIDALKRLPVDPLPTVNGTISGRVATADGNGIPGCEVRLTPQSKHPAVPRRKIEGPDDPQIWTYFESKVLAQLQAEISPYLRMKCLCTDEDGAYEATGLLDTDYYMSATCPGFELTPERRPEKLRAGDTLNWFAAPTTSIEVTVTADFALEKGESLQIIYTVDQRPRAIRAELGEPCLVALVDGDYTIFAEVHGRQARSEAVSIAVRHGTSLEPISLPLLLPATIAVTVQYVGAQPCEIHEVRCAPLKAGLSDEELLDDRRQLCTYLSWFGPEKRWSSRSIEPGDYVVGLFVERELCQTKHVTVARGGTTTMFTLTAPALADGIVVDISAPVEETRWTFQLAVPGQYYHTPAVWFLPDGRYLLICTRLADIGSPLWLTVSSKELGSRRLKLGATKGVVVNVDFAAAATLSVAATNLPAATWRNLRLNLSSADGVSMVRAFGSEDGKTGKIELGRVQPGDYTVTVTADGPQPMPVLWADKRAIQSTESQRIDIALPDMYEVVIKRGSLQVGTYMFLLWPGMPQGMSNGIEMEEDGTCVLAALPAGTYTVSYHIGGKNHRKSFTVKGATTVLLDE